MRSEAASSLPKVSYVKAIDIWLSLCMARVMQDFKIRRLFCLFESFLTLIMINDIFKSEASAEVLILSWNLRLKIQIRVSHPFLRALKFSLFLAYVFAALLEYAVANYLNRQSNGILYRNNINTTELSRSVLFENLRNLIFVFNWNIKSLLFNVYRYIDKYIRKKHLQKAQKRSSNRSCENGVSLKIENLSKNQKLFCKC